MFVLAGIIWIAYELDSSAYVTNLGVVPDQPVPFSYEHHVAGLGIHLAIADRPAMRLRRDQPSNKAAPR